MRLSRPRGSVSRTFKHELSEAQRQKSGPLVHYAYSTGIGAPGLGKCPSQSPVSKQVQFLAAHVIYGITLEGVRRLTLKTL